MAETWLLIHTAIAIGGTVAIIAWARIPPLLGLFVGAAYLGIATGLGFAGTMTTIALGFGELMTEIGLLIVFGVVMGSLLTSTRALQRLIELLLSATKAGRIPYVFAISLTTVFTSIYSDVLLVLTAPLARRIGARLGPRGVAVMGGALTAGIEVGLVFVVPGVGAVAVAGLLGVPFGQMLVYGLLIGLPTAFLTVFIFNWLVKKTLRWNPATDELGQDPADSQQGGAADEAHEGAASSDRSEAEPTTGSRRSRPAENSSERVATEVQGAKPLPLLLSLSPVLLTLVLIAFGAIVDATGAEMGVVGELGDPVFAMFVGAATSYLLGRKSLPSQQLNGALSTALTSAGPILVLTGISGSLAKVISESGLDTILAGYFSAGLLPPLILTWLIAALLHVAMGSISTAAITAAGILAPIAGNLDMPTVLIALAAGSGALFVPHVSSNFFWMFQSLFGFSTRGTFKTHSLAMTLSSVISLPLILLLSVFV